MSQVFSRDIKLKQTKKKFNLIYSITVTNDSFGIIPGFHLLSFTYFLPFSGRITDNQLHSKQFFESLRFSFCIRHLLIAFVFKKCCICRQNRDSFVKSGSEQISKNKSGEDFLNEEVEYLFKTCRTSFIFSYVEVVSFQLQATKFQTERCLSFRVDDQ